jgi:cation diffusion facilitator family transporter
MNSSERLKYAKKEAKISITGNSSLALLKILTGIFTGSMAVLADGVDSSFDILTSIITYIASVISNKPPDKEHPFGHEKAETVASKTLSLIIFFAGGQLILSSVQKLFTGEIDLNVMYIALIASVISCVVKFFLYKYKLKVGKTIQNKAIIADALNMRSDVLISLSVFISVLLVELTGMNWIDPVAGILVGIIVIKTAIELFWENAQELMEGTLKGDKIYNNVYNALKTVDNIHNPHKMRIRKFGYKYIIDLDIEVNPVMTVREAHNITKNVEKAIKEQIPNVYEVLIHVEPLGNIENENYGVNKEE